MVERQKLGVSIFLAPARYLALNKYVLKEKGLGKMEGGKLWVKTQKLFP